MYYPNEFSESEQDEIQQAINDYQILISQYDLALKKQREWKEEDYKNNGENRKGLENWIKELEIKIDIKDWRIKLIKYNRENEALALIHSSAKLDRNNEGVLTIDDRRKIQWKGSDLPVENWNRIEQQIKISQHSSQLLSESQLTQPSKNDKSGWEKYGGSGLFGSLSLLSLLFFLV